MSRKNDENISAMSGTAWHRTRIVCTLGPATDPPGVIEQLIRAGMDVARINASHATHADHARRIQQVRQAAAEAGRPVAILVDLPGPKFRLGDLPGGCLELEEGAAAVLLPEGIDEDVSDGGKVILLPVRNPELLDALREGERVFLADGAIELRVQGAGSHGSGGRDVRESRAIRCKAVAGGVVRSGSGINLPESSLEALVPTPDDRRHLAFALEQEVEWIGVSFVQSAEDIERVRALCPAGNGPLLMAKIEKHRALLDLDGIVAAADGVMVARGDLGVETDLAAIPIVQKRIIAAANAAARPVVTATQMLESMVSHERPTRAEVTDVANAVLDGTDAVMLSAETAIGRFPPAAVGVLHRVLAATEAEYGARMENYPAHSHVRSDAAAAIAPFANELSLSACYLATRTGARAIIARVRDMKAALEIARFRPRVPLVMVTDSALLHRSLAMVRGVAPLLMEADEITVERTVIEGAYRWLLGQGLARPGDCAVLLSASGTAGPEMDTLRTVRLEG